MSKSRSNVLRARCFMLGAWVLGAGCIASAQTSARDSGYVYGRGAVDDKDNLTAALMTMILLKRLNVPLDRDVIFVAEAGEEGDSSVGIGYLVNEQLPQIEAEYCLAEGGGVTRQEG